MAKERGDRAKCFLCKIQSSTGPSPPLTSHPYRLCQRSRKPTTSLVHHTRTLLSWPQTRLHTAYRGM